MTGIGMLRGGGGEVEVRYHYQSLVRRALLSCGIVSSLLYVTTDILGGLRYDGYDFSSQAISELGAIGAPSSAFVEPLFVVYQLLALAFGVGVWRLAAGRNRPLRITGAMLTLYGAIGFFAPVFTGTTFLAMHQRGSGAGMAADAPHIVLTAVLVLLLLLSIGFGAFAFGRRFRAYSLASLLVIIVFGVMTALLAPRIDAGLPTPGMGIYERINVYMSMLWIAVLATRLLERPTHREL